MQVSAPATREGGGLSYKWIVAGVIVFGIFMSILDSTIVNIAVPRLQSAFGSSLNSTQWVLTGYILAQGVATPLTGFLTDRIGIKRFYLISLAAFTLGSALCGLAWNLPMLILFRIIQGAGGAFLMPISMTLLYREFPPEERGTAMGFLGLPILLAPALGPTLGGYIVTFASWQLIFYVNIPIGILGFILATLLLRETQSTTRTTFDFPGFLLSGAGLALLLYGLSDASTDGWSSTIVLGTLSLGTLLLILFVVTELLIIRRGGQPLLDLRVFANGPFTTSSIASILVNFALYGGLFLIPIYLQELRGLSAYQAGLVLLPQAFASMVAMLAGGRLVDKIGVRAVVIPGLIILAIAMWFFTSLNLDIPFASLQLILILRSFAIGLCMQPLSVSALSEIEPRRLPQASAVSTTLRFVASSLAVAVISTMIQTQTKVHYTHLAERVTMSSRLGQFMGQMQALFQARGASPDAAHATVVQIVYGMLQKQSSVLAMQDTFWLSLVLTVVAVVATIFVQSRKNTTTPVEDATLTEEERAEQEKAREEAMLAV